MIRRFFSLPTRCSFCSWITSAVEWVGPDAAAGGASVPAGTSVPAAAAAAAFGTAGGGGGAAAGAAARRSRPSIIGFSRSSLAPPRGAAPYSRWSHAWRSAAGSGVPISATSSCSAARVPSIDTQKSARPSGLHAMSSTSFSKRSRTTTSGFARDVSHTERLQSCPPTAQQQCAFGAAPLAAAAAAAAGAAAAGGV